MAARKPRTTRSSIPRNGQTGSPAGLRVRTYRRRSTNEENQPYSIEAQDARLGPYIASQDGWTLTGQYADDASGATLDRDGLQKALRDAKAGRYNVLLVYRLDRLTRSIRGLLDIVDDLEEAGVALVSASEHFDTHTPVGRMVMQILAVFAEFERAIIIDRVVAGMERKAARGGWTAGTRPFGYTTDPATGFLVPNADAPLVPVIFDLYVHKRLGAHAVANHLNERGHRTRNNKPWNHKAVLKVLTNRAYIGEVWFRDQYHQAPHAPLVERALFDAAQALLDERGEDYAKRAANASDYLLAGLVHCDHCRKRFIGTAATGKTQRYRYYTCFSRQRYGTSTCPAERLPADQLEAALIEALIATYERADLIEQAVANTRQQAGTQRNDHQAELDKVTADLHATEDAIDRYLTAFEHNTLPEDECGPRVQRLCIRRDELRERQDELRDLLATTNITAPDERALAELRDRVREAMRHGTATTKKALLQALVAEIRVQGRHQVKPWFRVPNIPADTNTPSSGGVRTLSSEVELRGLEPLTPCMPCKRSSN